MIDGPPPPGPRGRRHASIRAASTAASRPGAGARISIPPAIPAAVLDELGATQDVLASLDARGLALRLRVDGRRQPVRAVVLDVSDGSLLGEVTASHVIEALAGRRQLPPDA